MIMIKETETSLLFVVVFQRETSDPVCTQPVTARLIHSTCAL